MSFAWPGKQVQVTGLLLVGRKAIFDPSETLGSRYQTKAWLTFGDGYLTVSVLKVARDEAL